MEIIRGEENRLLKQAHQEEWNKKQRVLDGMPDEEARASYLESLQGPEG